MNTKSVKIKYNSLKEVLDDIPKSNVALKYQKITYAIIKDF